MTTWRHMGLAIGLAISVPATAQVGFGYDSLKFLAALKEREYSKALEFVERSEASALNGRDSDGDGALHIVIRNRNGNWIGYLLSKGADPNLAGRGGDTPLTVAARIGFSEAVARLLQHRADVSIGNKLGETPLIVAVQQREPAIVRMLLQAGANPDAPDHATGYTARDYAKRETRVPELLELINTIKAKPNSAKDAILKF